MSNYAKIRKWLPGKDHILGTLRIGLSEGEASGVTIKSFVKTSERCNVSLREPFKVRGLKAD